MILALDTASTRTGYALGECSGPVETGSRSFREDAYNIGALMIAFEEWLDRMVDAKRVEVIAFEKPVRPFVRGNLDTFRKLYGIAGMVEVVANRWSVPCYEVDNQQLKKLIYGSGGQKPEPAQCVASANLWGFEAENADEADAVGVFLMTVKHQFPEAFGDWEAIRSAAAVSSGDALL